MKKFCIYVHLVKGPSLSRRKGNNLSNGGVSTNWCKYCIITFSHFLVESSSHEPSVVLFNSSINSMFVLVQPFRGHDWLSFTSWNDIPYLILHYWFMSVGHGILPKLFFRIFFSLNGCAHGYNVTMILAWLLTFSRGSFGRNISLSIL